MVHLSEADRLNGNNQQPASPTATIQSHPQRPPGSPILATVKSRPTPPPKPPLHGHEESSSLQQINSKNGASPGSSPAAPNATSSNATSSSFYSSSVSATTNQARTMGSILKGSVMDKVTHVFNATTSSGSSSTSPSSVSSAISPATSTTTDVASHPIMGNTNNKESRDSPTPTSHSGGKSRSSSMPSEDVKQKDRRTSTPEISSTSNNAIPGSGIGTGIDTLNTALSTTSAINIPKG